jgi:hypothetical protein
MRKLHDIISKKQWFILFNLGTLAALALSGRLTASLESLISNLFALLVVNIMALIASRRYPRWK